MLVFLAVLALQSPSLHGSHDSMRRQNDIADRYDLTRYKDRNDLHRAIDQDRLVLIKETAAYYFGRELGEADPLHYGLYRYARPWVRRFLDAEVARWFEDWHQRLEITSLVRTEQYQDILHRQNPNAVVGHQGWQRSAHLTGSAIDISYKDLHPGVVEKIRRRLLELERSGAVEATQEHRSLCFHIMVSPDYAGEIHHRKAPKRRTRSR